jgi:hypothetical protein
MNPDSGLIFISCGQVTQEEKQLGKDVCELVTKLTPHRPYFAENQSSVDGVTNSILRNLDDATALIAIMHHRDTVISRSQTQFIRASIWIEQEIAIAAFITQVLKRGLRVAAYIQEGIRREGLRDKIQLNPKSFKNNAEILTDLEALLPSWKDLPATLRISGPPKVRVEWEHSNPTNYIFKFVSKEAEEVIVREILLRHRGIELTEPIAPNYGEEWKISPRSTGTFGRPITHQKNPASVLVAISEKKDQFFREDVDALILCEIGGHVRELEHTFNVRVNRVSRSIDDIY